MRIYKETVEPALKATFLLFMTKHLTSKVAGDLSGWLALLLLAKYAHDKGERKANSLTNRLFGMTPHPNTPLEKIVLKADLIVDGTANMFDSALKKIF